MRVFLTGVTGYLGGRVAEELIGEGHALAVMVRTEADDAAARRLGSWALRCTLTDFDRLRCIAGDVDAIAHCAASDHPGFLPVNRAAIGAMLEGLRPGAGFAMQGGSLVFGDTGARAFDGTERFDPLPPLAGRAALEDWVLETGRRRALRVALLHASLAYGGGEGAAIPATLARAALLRGAAGYPDGADPLWSAVHVSDWARLIVAALAQAPVGGNSFPAGGPPVAIRDLGLLITRVAGLGAPVPVPPGAADAVWGPFGRALFLNQVFSSHRAESVLGWTPETNGLGEEMQRLLEDLARRGGPPA